LGQRERTLVAVVGDHGESLGDHGEETHSMFVYESALRVPLILWRPGRVPAGRVVQEPVRSTDLAPTLLELLGVPAPPMADGRSLVPLLEQRPAGPVPPLYAETLLPQFYMNWAPLLSLRDERYKLIQAPQPELYDLLSDPGEETNIFAREPQKARALQDALARLTGPGAGTMSVATLDREAMEKLNALGYVGAGAEPLGARPPANGDPKAMIAVFNRLRRANSAVRERRFDEALPLLAEALRRDPENAFARLVMGSAQMGQGRLDQAIVWFKKYLEIVPTSTYAHYWIAVCHLRAGSRDLALREADAVLAMDPRFSDARLLRGSVLAARGDYPGAVKELRLAVDTDPAKPMLRLDLAKVLAEAGRAAEARTEYEAALRVQSDYLPALTGLGALEAQQGDTEGALRTLTRALELDPAADEARFNLARVLALRGEAVAARAEYQRLLGDKGTRPDIRAAAQNALASLPLK